MSGTVAGTTFTVASDVAAILNESVSSTSCATYSDGGLVNPGCVPTVASSGQMVGLVLTNRAELTCGALQGGVAPHYANSDLLALQAFTSNGTLATGTYDIVTSVDATSGAWAQFSTSTSTCTSGTNLGAASAGAITLTEMSSTHATGTYSVTFGSQGTFAGSFDVAICDTRNGAGSPTADAGPLVCEQ